MKFYLSSYKFGNDEYIERLKTLIPENNTIGHINNAVDFVGCDPARAAANQKAEMGFLDQLGFKSEALDLKNYFGKQEYLQQKLNSLGALWVQGGNCFVLRQAM